jgi:GT2 family glycosyltransferase
MVSDAPAEGLTIPGPGLPITRLSVIVVNHRRPDLLTEALRALFGSGRRPDEIVVLEADALEAPTLPADEHDPPIPVRLVLLEDNPGYAAACNRGAATCDGDWLLFMNADVMVSADCLEAVLGEASADPSVGIATCRLVRPDGQLDHACHRGIPSVLDSLFYRTRLDRLRPRSRRLAHYRMSWLDPNGSHEIEACTGAFLLIRRSALEAVGGWDERYWFYAEDLDLCLRVTQVGWRVRYVGSVTATHVKGGSSNLRRSPQDLTDEQRATRQRVREAAIESHQRFYHEHLEADTARPLRPLVRAMFAAQRFFTARFA